MTFRFSALIAFVAIVESASSVALFDQCGGSELSSRFERCDPGLICYAKSTFYANVSFIA